MERVGVYRVVRELGRGSSGVVYEAVDERLGRRVALKVLAEELMHDAVQRTRFEREARILAALDHPNVARLHELEDTERGAVLVLEFVEGESLDDVLDRGPLPLGEALDVARQVADGLEAAHEAGVVHRDLKPANVILSSSGTAKILDFGLARDGALDGSPLGASSISSEGVAIGTPLSMAPEQLRGKPLDRRADVWAFGCFLHHLLTGRSPFARQSTADVVTAILEEPWNPAILPAATPEAVRALLVRCFEKDPRSRLRDLGEARVLLERVQRGDTTPRDADFRAPRRWRAVALGAVVALVAGWTARDCSAPPTPVERDAAAGRLQRLVLHVPDLERRSYPRLLADGSGFVHEVLEQGPDGSRRVLAVRRFDAFQDERIEGSEDPETFDFTADGRELVVVRAAAGAYGPLRVVRLPLVPGLERRELGELPTHTDRTGSVAVLGDGTVVLTANPGDLVLLAGDGSGKLEVAPLRFEGVDSTLAPDVLGAIPGTRGVLGRTWEYGPDGISPGIVTVDCDARVVRPLLQNAGHAQLLPSGRLLFTRGDSVVSTRFDFEHWKVDGEFEPLTTGLRSSTAWVQTGEFHASADGTLLWRPGSSDATRSVLWRVVPGQEPAPWMEEPLPYLGFVNADSTSAYLTVIVVGATRTYEVWGTEVASPTLRRLLGSPATDFVAAEACPARNELYYMRFGRDGTTFGRVALDDPRLEEEEVLLHAESDSLMFSAMSADATKVFLRRTNADGARLLLLDATAPLPQEPRVLLHERLGLRELECTSDGKWISYRSVTSGVSRLVVRAVGPGGLGPEIFVPQQGDGIGAAWWRDSIVDEPAVLYAFDAENRRILAYRLLEDGGSARLAAPTVVVTLDGRRFRAVDDLADGSFVGLLVEEEEARFDRLNLLLDAWSD